MAWRRGRYSTVGNMDRGSNPAGALCELPPVVGLKRGKILTYEFISLTLEYIQVPRC
jgi:hypothetical protein